MYFAFQGVFSSWIWQHFETYIDHCYEVIHFAHESVFFSGSGFLFVNITSQYDQIAMLNFQRIQEENSQILKKPVAAFELAHFFSRKKSPCEGWNSFFKDISH